MEYHAIAADTEEEARQYLYPLIKENLDKRDPNVKYVNDMHVSTALPITKKGPVEELYFEYAE